MQGKIASDMNKMEVSTGPTTASNVEEQQYLCIYSYTAGKGYY